MAKKKRRNRCLPVCCSGAVSPLDDFDAQPTNEPDDLQTRKVTEVNSGNSEDQSVGPRCPNVSFSGLDVSALDQIAIDSEDQQKDQHLSLPELGESSSETGDEGQDTKLTSASAELDNSETPSRHAQSQLGTGLPPVNEVERRSLDCSFDISAAPVPDPPASRLSESDPTDQDRPVSSASDSSSEANTHKKYWLQPDIRTEKERSSTPGRVNRVLAMARESRRTGLKRELFPSPPPMKKAVRKPVETSTADISSSELSSDAELYRLLGLEKPKAVKYKTGGVISLRRASAQTDLPSVFVNNSDSLVDSLTSNSGSSTDPELRKLLGMSKSTDEDDLEPFDAFKKRKPLPPVKRMSDRDSPPEVLIDNSPKDTKFLKEVINGSYRAKSPLAPIPTTYKEQEMPSDVSESLSSKSMSSRGAFASAGSAIFQEEQNIRSLRINRKPDVKVRSVKALDPRKSRVPDSANTVGSSRMMDPVCPPTTNPREPLQPSPPDSKAPELGARSLSRFPLSRTAGNKVSDKNIESPNQPEDSQRSGYTTSGLRRPKVHQFMSFGKMSASVTPEETSMESVMVLDSRFGPGPSTVQDHRSSHRSSFGSYAPCPPVGKVADRHMSFNSMAPLPSTFTSVDKPPTARRQTGCERSQSPKWQSPSGPKCTPEMLPGSNTKAGMSHFVESKRMIPRPPNTRRLESGHTTSSSSSESVDLSPRPAWNMLKAGLKPQAEVSPSSSFENKNTHFPFKPNSSKCSAYPSSTFSHSRQHQ